jgi:hypothetical protein
MLGIERLGTAEFIRHCWMLCPSVACAAFLKKCQQDFRTSQTMPLLPAASLLGALSLSPLFFCSLFIVRWQAESSESNVQDSGCAVYDCEVSLHLMKLSQGTASRHKVYSYSVGFY